MLNRQQKIKNPDKWIKLNAMENQAKKISYLEILKTAFQITWKHHYLWWFGLFIALSGVMTSFDYSFRGDGAQAPLNFAMAHPYATLLGSILFIFGLIIFAIFGTIGRGGLINSLGEMAKNKKHDFKTGMRSGKKYFWKIFFISFGIGLFNIAMLTIMITPVAFLFYSKSFIIGTLLAVIALLILLPLLFLTACLRIFGYLYVVLGNISIWAALENAYNLLAENLKATIIILLMFVPIIILFAFIAIALIIPLAIIFSLLGLILFLIFKEAGTTITLVLFGLVTTIALLGIKSFYEVFAQAVWFLFFQEIAKPEEPEKVAEDEKEVEAIPKPAPIENI